jgi:hypothetical protein
MTFKEALELKLKAIRLPYWATKTDRLVLPEHGPWCTLIANDGFELESEMKLLITEFINDPDSSWEEYK